MKRLEDQLKDHFDHFQPEVDAAVWQQLSQQLPKGPAPSPAAKGVTSVAGSKAVVIIGGLAAVITAGVLLYRTLVSDDKSFPKTPPAPPEMVMPVEVESTPEIPSTSTQEIQGTSKPTTEANAPSVLNPLHSQHTSFEGQILSNQLPAGQTALTGQTGPDKGGATAVPPEPVSSSRAPANANTPVIPATPPAAQLPAATTASVPKPVLILSTKRGFAPLSVTFMTNQEGQTADFDFGDGHSTYGKHSTTHRYEESGIYDVSCTINGQVLQSTVSVSGRIPSAFSPNGDGINDRFTLDNPERLILDIRIFSRSGQLIFSFKGADVAWDGRLPSGDPAPDGTYLVHILAPSSEGAPNQQKATIQLFR